MTENVFWKDKLLDPFRLTTRVNAELEEEEYYWHTLYFSTLKEAQQAKKYIIATQYDICCTINPCEEEYEVCFSTNYKYGDAFRTHLLTHMGVSPHASFFNEDTEDMPARERALEESPVTWLQVVIAILCTIMLLPLTSVIFLVSMPMILVKHFRKEGMFTSLIRQSGA